MDKVSILADILVNYSIDILENEKVLITVETDNCNSLVKELIKKIVLKKGIPYVKVIDPEINAFILENTFDNRINLVKKYKKFEVENFDAFIVIRYSINDYIEQNVNSDIRRKIGKATEEFDSIRINKRKWVLLNYPSTLDSFKAHMTNEQFYNYAMNVMTYDYKKMEQDIKPLRELMEKTNKVRVLAPNTDLIFSIKDIPAIPCCGKNNIPDGEIFTAPIRNSVNGIITYNTPSPYQGNVFHHVQLEFVDGKIVNAKCDEDDEELNKIFDIDEGARYIGEFAIGLNPLIKNPMGDILFDEKIIGSIHFTPGRCYDDAFNGNTSSVHWDMVLIEREEYGGGELYFDDVLIRKNGKFLLDELKHLNY